MRDAPQAYHRPGRIRGVMGAAGAAGEGTGSHAERRVRGGADARGRRAGARAAAAGARADPRPAGGDGRGRVAAVQLPARPGGSTGCPSRCRPGSRTGPNGLCFAHAAARSWCCPTAPGSRSPERAAQGPGVPPLVRGGGLRAFLLLRPVKGGACAHRDRAARPRGGGAAGGARPAAGGDRAPVHPAAGARAAARAPAHARVPGQPRCAGRVLRRSQRAGRPVRPPAAGAPGAATRISPPARAGGSCTGRRRPATASCG